MANPFARALAVLVLAACSANDPAGPATTGHPHGSKADTASEAGDFDELVTLLRADGTATMPPLGEQYAANELDASVKVYAAADVKVAANDLIKELSEEYSYEEAPTGTLVDHFDEDVNVLLVSGWNDDGIKRDLLDTIVAGKRAQASGLLDGSFLHFRIYQTASEITAEDVFVYRPYGVDRALIWHLSYVHA